MSVPFSLRRLWLLIRGLRVDRNRPAIDRLRSISDAERFVWAMLPHAARSFATSILLLPARPAKAAAVGYLYCRMLDTYEDLCRPDEAPEALEAFAARMNDLAPPPDLPPQVRTERDRAHVLLIERCRLVDDVFCSLPPEDRMRIVELVQSMARGMIWSHERFAAQGGVLVDHEQVRRYCHYVIGEPALFTLLLLDGSDLEHTHSTDALAASELIQLANITRDIEHDLERGIGYHPVLRPHLGSTTAAEPVRTARRELMAQALPQVTAYRRLAQVRSAPGFSLPRAASVAMLLYTDRHYRWCAERVGIPSWSGPGRSTTIVLASLAAAVSPKWSARLMKRVERDFIAASAALA